MFRKIVFVILLVVALSQTACAQIQIPDSLMQLSNPLQPNAALAPSSDSSAEALQGNSQLPAPGAPPQAGTRPGNAVQAPAALLQIFHQLGWEAGLVVTTASDQISVRTVKSGPDKIAIAASTIFIVPGAANATLADIHAGDRIIADVPKNQSYAALVMGLPKDYDKDNLLLGMVQSNANGSIALRLRGGSDTLTTSATTQVVKVLREGVALGSASDLQNGALVIAIGQPSDEDFSAQVIYSLPKGALDLAKRLGGDGKNPAQPPSPKPGN